MQICIFRDYQSGRLRYVLLLNQLMSKTEVGKGGWGWHGELSQLFSY